MAIENSRCLQVNLGNVNQIAPGNFGTNVVFNRSSASAVNRRLVMIEIRRAVESEKVWRKQTSRSSVFCIDLAAIHLQSFEFPGLHGIVTTGKL